MTGVVTDDDGKPLANATVGFTVVAQRGSNYAHASGVTDGSGFYRFAAVPGAWCCNIESFIVVDAGVFTGAPRYPV
jgi:hypothetical protein